MFDDASGASCRSQVASRARPGLYWKLVCVAWVVVPMSERDMFLQQVAGGNNEDMRFAKPRVSALERWLCSLSSPKAIAPVVQCTPHAHNGFEACRRIVRTFESDAPVRRMVMLSAVLKFDLRGPDFRESLVEWENRLRRYERSLPAGESMGESIKIAMVTQGVPIQLRLDLQVASICACPRSVILAIALGDKPTGGSRMEVGAVGKGKGKGRARTKTSARGITMVARARTRTPRRRTPRIISSSATVARARGTPSRATAADVGTRGQRARRRPRAWPAADQPRPH